MSPHFNRLLLAVVVALVWPTAAAQELYAYKLPSDGPSLEEVGLDRALDLVLAYELPMPTARKAMLAAAESGDPALAPRLKAIAAAYPEAGSVGFLALHALWELGEPPEYFFELAERAGVHDQFAYNALNVAARAPTAEGLARAEAAAAARDALVLGASTTRGAARRYADVLERARALGTEPLRDEVDFLLYDLRRVFNWVYSHEGPIIVNEHDDDGGLHPETVWARRALKGLAAAAPDSVAAYLVTSVEMARLAEKFADSGPGVAARMVAWFRAYAEEAAFVGGPYAALPGAVTVAEGASAFAASFSGAAFTVSGAPVALDGSADDGAAPVLGIAVAEAAALASVEAALAPSQRGGVGGRAPVVAVSHSAFDAAVWAGALAERATVRLDARPRGPVGTAEAPAVAYAPEGARLAGGFRGAGVLVVDGPFEMRGDAEWLGAVVVRGTAEHPAGVSLSGAPRIVGGLVLVPAGSETASLDVRGRSAVRYSPAALGVAEAAARASH